MPTKRARPLTASSAPRAREFTTQIKRLQALRYSQAESPALAEFDAETEQLIRRMPGDATKHLEAYHLATVGEAESIVNIPQAAQEDAMQDLPRKAIEQRRQVLEVCMSELGENVSPQRPKRPARAPAKKTRTKAKPAKAVRAKGMKAKSRKVLRPKAKKTKTRRR